MPTCVFQSDCPAKFAQSRIAHFSGAFVLSLAAPLLLLSACTEEPSVELAIDQHGGLSTSVSPPGMLVQSRAIDQSLLQLSIGVNGVEYSVDINSESGSSVLSRPYARGEQLDIVVTWSELYNGQLLTLAQATTRETVPVDDRESFDINIKTDSYSTNFDFDNDRITNLKERNNDTDPTVAEILEDPIVQVPIRFVANIPDQLRDVNGEINDTLLAVANIDNAPVSLNREGDIWVGESSRPANADLLVNYSFYTSIKPNAKLANWEGRVNSTDTGITVDIPSSDYDYQIDSDGDGKNNLQEIKQGTNPEDKNDPRPNPCDISNFEPGCNTDTDGDGSPDSVETESADEDGDSIPDYKESKNDDADEDGFNAELDKDETDPCVPSNEAIACVNAGSTNPPVIEPPAASPLSYEFFQGSFENVPDFNLITATGSGTATTFLLPPNNGENSYAVKFTGKLFIEQAGEYTFYTESDDGSLLYIDNNVVVNNDGTHALVEASGVVVLAAGLYDIVLEYFQNGGAEGLNVSWSSSAIAKQIIPESVLFGP